MVKRKEKKLKLKKKHNPVPIFRFLFYTDIKIKQTPFIDFMTAPQDVKRKLAVFEFSRK